MSAAAEFRFGMELMDAVRQHTVPYLGQWRDRRVLLLEFPHGELPFGAEKLTAWLLANKVLPMIAHPERNKTVLRQPGRLRPFLEQGCLLQITSGSLTGRFGTACQALARRLLELDVVTLIATDAHNLEHRPPLLAEGRDAAAQILGESRARRLVQDNPWLIAQSHFDASAG